LIFSLRLNISAPMKHHTSPAFYLSPWGSPLCEMRLIRGRIACKSRYPAGTGYHVDLYKAEGVPEENAHDLEIKFMSPLDNDASLAVQMLLQGREPREPRYRQGWAMFVLSLLYRHKESVLMLKGHMAELWREATAKLEPMWAAERGPGDTRSLGEAVKEKLGDRADADAADMLAGVIQHDRAIPDITNMVWTVVDLSGASRTLLTSDRAIVMPMGLANPDAYIAVPISPTKVFVAAYNNRFRQLPTASKSEVVRIVNKDVVRQAREFVWGADDSQKDFVQKYIGAFPDRVILSEEQKQQVLRQARGETDPP
jgi:hypothetical protein